MAKPKQPKADPKFMMELFVNSSDELVLVMPFKTADLINERSAKLKLQDTPYRDIRKTAINEGKMFDSVGLESEESEDRGWLFKFDLKKDGEAADVTDDNVTNEFMNILCSVLTKHGLTWSIEEFGKEEDFFSVTMEVK